MEEEKLKRKFSNFQTFPEKGRNMTVDSEKEVAERTANPESYILYPESFGQEWRGY